MSTAHASHDASQTAPAAIPAAAPASYHFTEVGEPITTAAGEVCEIAFNATRDKPATIDSAYARQQIEAAQLRAYRQHGGRLAERDVITAAAEALAIKDETVMYSRYSRALITTIAGLDPIPGKTLP